MSRLDELIAELCPDGVEYKTLGDLFNTKNGYTPSKTNPEYWIDGTIPWFRMEDIRTNGRILNHSLQYVNEIAVKKGSLFPENSILVATSATVGEHALITVESLSNQRFTCLMLKDEYKSFFIPKFLYYYCFKLDTYCISNLNQGSFPSVDMNKFYRFEFPLPPLEVQHEIVRILDAYSEKVAELTDRLAAELDARKKQYQEYSHMLFSQSDRIKKTTIGEIADVCMCKRIKKDQTTATGDVPFYQNGTLGGSAKLFISNELFQEFSSKYRFPKKGDVMLSTVGTIGKTVIYDGEPAYFQDSNIVWLDNKSDEVSNEYLYWFCMSQPWKLPGRATLKHLHNYMILDTEISIPSLERQQYVISKFQELSQSYNSIFKNLSAEIEARRKQYEHYRDRLLTFKEKTA